MLRNIQPAGERFLADLDRIRSAAERARQQLSSGLRISQPSDAPDEIGGMLALRAEIDRNSQTVQNLHRIQNETNVAEQTLQSAVKLLDRARVLATQSLGTLPTPAGRQNIALEADSILQQMVSLAGATVEGRYIFSGGGGEERLYDYDGASPGRVISLASPGPARLGEDTAGLTFEFSLDAGRIFDQRSAGGAAAPGNVFAALNGFRQALESADPAALEQSLANLRAAGDYVNGQLSFYGAVQNRLAGAVDAGNRREIELNRQLSGLRDADAAAAIVELTQSQAHEQAAMSAEAQRPRTSLFDLLRF